LALAISGGLYLFYDVARYIDKQEAQEHISSNQEISVIRMSLNDFKRNDGTKEVWANGKLYDISSYSIRNDTVTINVYHDEQEESLVNDISTGFQPSSSCAASDNFQHISRHQMRPSTDAKILIAPLSIVLAKSTDPQLFQLPVNDYTSVPYASVIKPPPRIS